MIAHRDAVLNEAMRRERVTREEALAVLRSKDSQRVEPAGAVVLETDSSFSVLDGEIPAEPSGTLKNVSGE